MSKLVVKDNALMNASYNLDLVEQRLILLAIVEASNAFVVCTKDVRCGKRNGHPGRCKTTGSASVRSGAAAAAALAMSKKSSETICKAKKKAKAKRSKAKAKER